MLFQTGQILATSGAVSHLAEHGLHPMALIMRHVSGDYGELCHDDVMENIRALGRFRRILSAYYVGAHKVYVITEADRDSTTVLMASEY